MFKKIYLISFLALALSACGSSGSSTEDVVDKELPEDNPLNSNPTVIVSGDALAKTQSVVVLLASATDEDGSIVSYEWSQVSGPTLALLNATSSSISIKPEVDETTDFQFKVVVTDDKGGQGESLHTVSVYPYAKPAITLNSNYTVDEENSITLNPEVSVDPDLSYLINWSIEDDMEINSVASGNGFVITAPSVNQDTTLTVKATVVDGRMQSAEFITSVNIKNIPIDTVLKALAELEKSGDLNQLDQSNTLAGKDVDFNGIRDDIEIYINQQEVSELQEIALSTAAKSIQRIVTLDLENESDVNQAGENSAKSAVCLFEAFGDVDAAKNYLIQLGNLTGNTKARAQKLYDYHAARNGFITRLPVNVSC